jgi:hypothetical protein
VAGSCEMGTQICGFNNVKKIFLTSRADIISKGGECSMELVNCLVTSSTYNYSERRTQFFLFLSHKLSYHNEHL